MQIEFDFRQEHSRLFGPIRRPIAEIALINNGKEILETFYVDSGADITLIPKSVGDILGFTVEKLDDIKEIKGIGNRSIPMIIKKIRLMLGNKILDSRIAWALIEEVPLLLGREDVFNFFDVCFKRNQKTVFTD